MIELAVYTHTDGDRWRLFVPFNRSQARVILQRSKPGDFIWTYVLDVCSSPSDIGIEIGIEPHERNKVLNPATARAALGAAVAVVYQMARVHKIEIP